MVIFDKYYTKEYLKWTAIAIALTALIYFIKSDASVSNKMVKTNSQTRVLATQTAYSSNEKSDIIATLQTGTDIQILAQNEKAYLIQTPSGIRGFVEKYKIGDSKATVRKKKIAVYQSNPDGNNKRKIIDSLSQYDTIRVLSAGNYSKIEYNGKTGFIDPDGTIAFVGDTEIPVILETSNSCLTLKGLQEKIMGKTIVEIESKFKISENIRSAGNSLVAKYNYSVYDEENKKSYSCLNITYTDSIAADYNFDNATEVKQWKYLTYFPLTTIFFDSGFFDVFTGDTQLMGSWAYGLLSNLSGSTGFLKVIIIIFAIAIALFLLVVSIAIVAFIPYIVTLPFNLFFIYSPVFSNKICKILFYLSAIFSYYSMLNIIVIANPSSWLLWTLVFIVIYGVIRTFGTGSNIVFGTIKYNCLSLINDRCKFCHRVDSYRITKTEAKEISYRSNNYTRTTYEGTWDNTKHYLRKYYRDNYMDEHFIDTYECLYCTGYFKRERVESTLIGTEQV